jgi:hypothetical protein
VVGVEALDGQPWSPASSVDDCQALGDRSNTRSLVEVRMRTMRMRSLTT